MFSQPRAQYTQSPPVDVTLGVLNLDPESNQTGRKRLKTALKPEHLRKIATVPLPSTGQSQGFSIGFFEQGILTGLGLATAVILPTLGYTAWFVGSRAWRALRK